MKTTIIIPAYNASGSISRAIRSCINQTYPSVEIIIIDDGSTDETVSILKKEFGSINDVVIKSKNNEGVGRARNDGIKISKGDYLYFLDADDYLEPDTIKRMVNAIEQEYADVVISGYAIESRDAVIKITPPNHSSYSPLENFILDNIVSSPWAKLFRADIVKKNNIKFSNYKIMEDGFFNIRYFCEVSKIAIVNSPLYVYDKGLSTSTTNITSEKLRLIDSAMEEQEKIVLSHSTLCPEHIRILFLIRRLRLAVLFPLQCGSRHQLIKQDAKYLASQGLFTSKLVSFHEKVQLIAFLIHNRCYDLVSAAFKVIKKVLR